MKFEYYYNNLSGEDLNNLNKAWRIFDFPIKSNDYFNKYVMSFLFEKENLKKAITGEIENIFIGEKAQEYLIYKTLGYEFSDYDLEKEKLRNKFILFNEEIPEEIKEIILKNLINKLIFDIEDEPIEVKATPFLKLILMINYVSKNNLEFNDMFKRVNVEKGKLNRKIILEYINIRKLFTDDGKFIDANRYNLWIVNNSKAIHDFYNFIIIQFNINRIFDLFKVISRILDCGKKEGWINVNEIEKIIDLYEKEIEIAIDLGIILCKKYDNKSFIKFSSEWCFFATGERPNAWSKKEIILTPLYEVFIPYNFDPFVVQAFDYIEIQNLKKNKKSILYNDDYFINFDISEMKKLVNNLSGSKIIGYIKEYCDDIPDIVRDEIMQETCINK